MKIKVKTLERFTWFMLILVCLGMGTFAVAQSPTKKPSQGKSKAKQSVAPAKSNGKPKANSKSVAVAKSKEAEWIWSPAHEKDHVPNVKCYFRKAFTSKSAESATIQVAADDRYRLFVNGREAGTGENWRLITTFDITDKLIEGKNVIAVEAENTEGNSSAMVARMLIRQSGGAESQIVSDISWKTSLREEEGWQTNRFADATWIPAKSFGDFATAAPWARQVASIDSSGMARFLVPNQFEVEQVAEQSAVGSVLAMTFNEFGQILASTENGAIQLISDANQDGVMDTISVYCDSIKGCQGLLAVNGQVYVTGIGPEGLGLYRLADEDLNGEAERVDRLVEFECEVHEHGVHGLVLGADGMIYVMVGNHTQVKSSLDSQSPYHHPVEGDLLTPKYEDPLGHATNIKAPGGCVLRLDTEGNQLQLVAGGFRNAYDLAVNRDGELFTFDSDMEWDEGMPWYRPTRVLHVVPGGEYGWRSGWSKWPTYYHDSLPSTVELGRGSPTGLEFYNHTGYPTRYHNSLFACDWSQGRILSIRLKRSGASYIARSEVFLQGRPLNATDVAVGPDGWLYFSTGGRGTEGGIYRVVWKGNTPPQPKHRGVIQAINQPQLQSAWARQSIATMQAKMGDNWGPQIAGTVTNTNLPPEARAQALDVMQLFGPIPDAALLTKAAADRSPILRAKAAAVMGLQGDESLAGVLAGMLADPDQSVRRMALEALCRCQFMPETSVILPLLADPDRYVAWSAGRALQEIPIEDWQPKVSKLENTRAFLQGALALLSVPHERSSADEVLQRGTKLLQGFLSDEEFIGLMRVFELAYMQDAGIAGEHPELQSLLAEEFPAENEPRMNHDLIRLLTHLNEPTIIPRALEYLKSNAPQSEKVFTAMHLCFIKSGWNVEQKLALLEFLERAHSSGPGASFNPYLDNVTRDFVATFDPDEQHLVLGQGERMPTAALQVLSTITELPHNTMLRKLIELDGKLQGNSSASARQLATGIVAVLGSTKDPAAMAYLRELFDSQPDRREDLAMGLAQSPGGDNWAILVRSLSVIEGVAAQEVLSKLAEADQSPEQPEPIRQVILAGVRLGDEGGNFAVALLEKWTGEKFATAKEPASKTLKRWQQWFQQEYPNSPPATLPVETLTSRYSYGELLGYLSGGNSPKGDPLKGKLVFEKAQCVKCHRMGQFGEGVGPDLSTVSRRFQIKEIVESVVHPSQVISDQFATKTVVTSEGLTVVGIVGEGGNGAIVVLQSDGKKQTIRRDDIESISPNPKSTMPEGLLNNLSLDEIAHLFAFLGHAPTKMEPPQSASRTKVNDVKRQ